MRFVLFSYEISSVQLWDFVCSAMRFLLFRYEICSVQIWDLFCSDMRFVLFSYEISSVQLWDFFCSAMRFLKAKLPCPLVHILHSHTCTTSSHWLTTDINCLIVDIVGALVTTQPLASKGITNTVSQLKLNMLSVWCSTWKLSKKSMVVAH